MTSFPLELFLGYGLLAGTSNRRGSTVREDREMVRREHLGALLDFLIDETLGGDYAS